MINKKWFFIKYGECHNMSKEYVCVGTGLVALDIIYNKKSDMQPSFLVGGSCGNVLTILSYMGWDSFPFARLGKDTEGERIIEDMKKWSVKTRFIEKEDMTHSPRIIERVFEGERPRHRFYFKCEHGNWLPQRKAFLLKSFQRVQNKIPKASVFYFDRATPSAYEIALHLKKQNAVIVFEPPKFLQDDKTFLKCLKISDIVKHCYNQARNIEEFDISIPLEIQTKGEEGLQYKAEFLKQKSWKEMRAIPTDNLVDAAGSGDWLTAGLIHTLRNHKSLKRVTEEKLEDALNFGQVLASLNCSYHGARGMMYHISKEELLRIAAKRLKSKEKQIELPTRQTKKLKLSTKLSSECKVCLCTT